MELFYKGFQIGLLIGWFWLYYTLAYNTFNNPLYPTEKVTALAKNAVCKTELNWDYSYCYLDVSYTFDDVNYKTKAYQQVENIPLNGEEVIIEINKEIPTHVFHPLKPGERYKYGFFTVFPFIITSVVNVIGAITTICLYIESRNDAIRAANGAAASKPKSLSPPLTPATPLEVKSEN